MITKQTSRVLVGIEESIEAWVHHVNNYIQDTVHFPMEGLQGLQEPVSTWCLWIHARASCRHQSSSPPRRGATSPNADPPDGRLPRRDDVPVHEGKQPVIRERLKGRIQVWSQVRKNLAHRDVDWDPERNEQLGPVLADALDQVIGEWCTGAANDQLSASYQDVGALIPDLLH
ncbi:MAG: hypothetical protein R3C39_10310 [Dehalococcoidia bacterium]